jgi:uncharacterized protein YbjQ (UPF0145 family)
MMELALQLVPVLLLLALGYGVGTLVSERRHLQSLARREEQYCGMLVTNLKEVSDPESITNAVYVSGDAVIATDYFKSFVAGLRNIVGGEVKTFDSLITRARREATLRMLAEANRVGASEVWNVRQETSNIRSAGGTTKAVSVEAFTFGTAVVRR